MGSATLKVNVTIGICVKNVEKTIKDTLNSIVNQDYPHELMKIIVIDGQSRDKTLKIVKEILSKTNIQSIILHENKGLGFARQMVVDNAEGEYIIWVDGDMILPKDHVRAQVEFMKKNPKVGIAAGRHGIYLEASLFASLEDIAYLAVDCKYGQRANLRLPGTGGAIYRVKALKQVGGFDVNIKGVGEDIETAYRIKEAGWLIYRGTRGIFYEQRKTTLKSLWNHYFWYGYGASSVIRKNRKIIEVYKMTPPAGFLAGVWYSLIAYKLLHQKRVFLLPFHYAFKRLAWCCGFIKGQKGAR